MSNTDNTPPRSPETAGDGQINDDQLNDGQARSSDGQPFKDFITVRLPRLQAKLNAQASAILAREGGLTIIQWRILFLLHHLGPSTATQLNEASGIDPGLLSRKIRSMSEAELLLVEDSEIDHRRKTLSLTDKGQALYDRALPAMQLRQQRMRNFMPPEDMERFYDYLSVLEAVADEEM